MTRGWSAAERQKARDDAPRLALAARIGGRELREVARDALSLARGGLKRRARLDKVGLDETRYLDPLDAIVAEGRAPALHWIERFEGPWGGSAARAFREALI